MGMGFGLGGGYRLTIDASYLQMSGAAQFSGPMSESASITEPRAKN